MVRHNELRDGFADLARKAFTPTHVRDDPLIFTCCAMKRTTAKLAMSKTTPSKKNREAMEHKGDLLIHELFQNETDSFHNVCVVNTDAKYHLVKTP